MSASGFSVPVVRNSDGASEAVDQASVTQAASISAGITCNAHSGLLTTVSQTIAAGAEQDIVITNSKVKATDGVLVWIKTQNGTGTFIAAVIDVQAGQFTIRLTNLHASAAGNDTLVIGFRIIPNR